MNKSNIINKVRNIVFFTLGVFSSMSLVATTLAEYDKEQQAFDKILTEVLADQSLQSLMGNPGGMAMHQPDASSDQGAQQDPTLVNNPALQAERARLLKSLLSDKLNSLQPSEISEQTKNLLMAEIDRQAELAASRPCDNMSPATCYGDILKAGFQTVFDLAKSQQAVTPTFDVEIVRTKQGECAASDQNNQEVPDSALCLYHLMHSINLDNLGLSVYRDADQLREYTSEELGNLDKYTNKGEFKNLVLTNNLLDKDNLSGIFSKITDINNRTAILKSVTEADAKLFIEVITKNFWWDNNGELDGKIMQQIPFFSGLEGFFKLEMVPHQAANN
jgi:hypothetical protein